MIKKAQSIYASAQFNMPSSSMAYAAEKYNPLINMSYNNTSSMEYSAGFVRAMADAFEMALERSATSKNDVSPTVRVTLGERDITSMVATANDSNLRRTGGFR